MIHVCILFKISESRLFLWYPTLTKIIGCDYHYTELSVSYLHARLPLETCQYDLSWSTICKNSRKRVYLSTVLFSGFYLNWINCMIYFHKNNYWLVLNPIFWEVLWHHMSKWPIYVKFKWTLYFFGNVFFIICISRRVIMYFICLS